jgi:putative ABC transport system permease protein
MLWNLIKVALRSIRKEWGYSMIIVLGLTIGIVSSLFLLLYVFDDISYDRFFRNKDRMVRVISHIKETDDEFTWSVAQVPFAQQVKQDYPEVEEVVRMNPEGRIFLTYNQVSQYEEDLYYADSTFFKVFSYDLLQGDPQKALTRPGTIVLTKSLAAKFFGEEDPFGKTLKDGRGRTYEVTGLMKDIPRNTHIRFSGLISRSSLPPDNQIGSWGNFGWYTYLLLTPSTDYRAFQDKMKEMYDKYMGPIFKQYNISIEYLLEPVTDIYLKSEARGNPGPKGSITFVYVFSVVAFFMLLIASINYMNLATARSARRSREVGLRKVVGSGRGTLILQFLSESIVLTLIALLLSVAIIIVLMPSFNQIANKFFDLHTLLNYKVLLTLLGMLVFVGIIGGSYPSLYLSRFSPTVVFKNELGAGSSNFLVRKILVVFQFAISLALIVVTWIIYNQLSYMKKMDVGFDKENVVILELENRQMMRQYPVLRDALINYPGIMNVSSSSNRIGDGTGKILLQVETADGGMEEKGINLYPVDYDFIKTMGIQIIEGRDFSRDFPADSNYGVIINETMAKRFNWDKPIGKKISQIGNDSLPAHVVGVMKDFKQLGLYSPMETLMLILRTNGYYCNIKIDGKKVEETLRFIESKWKEIFPDRTFEYKFLADHYNEQFQTDERRGTIFTWFSVLIIVIACLGLFGLASFTMEQRTKEVGVRKVLGASVGTIVSHFLKQFILLVVISMVFAFPAAWFYIRHWLQDYPYPTAISAWLFLGTAVLAIVITVATVSYSTVKAGLRNPADSLRTE